MKTTSLLILFSICYFNTFSQSKEDSTKTSLWIPSVSPSLILGFDETNSIHGFPEDLNSSTIFYVDVSDQQMTQIWGRFITKHPSKRLIKHFSNKFIKNYPFEHKRYTQDHKNKDNEFFIREDCKYHLIFKKITQFQTVNSGGQTSTSTTDFFYPIIIDITSGQTYYFKFAGSFRGVMNKFNNKVRRHFNGEDIFY